MESYQVRGKWGGEWKAGQIERKEGKIREMATYRQRERSIWGVEEGDRGIRGGREDDIGGYR